MLQAHSGIKGVVRNALNGEPISNALIHVKNITKIDSNRRRNTEIDHDVTSGA